MNAKTKPIYLLLSLVLSLVLITAGCSLTAISGNPAAIRPDVWATRLNMPGLPNFHQVDGTLYRGAQPTAQGMRHLRDMGIKTVINLRSLHSDMDEINDTGLAYEPIPMTPWHPKENQVVRFLRIVTDKTRTPVFVHCQHGADRTGMMCATYRVIVRGWSKKDAIAEMTQGGFGYHTIWKNLVTFVEELDVNEIKKKMKDEG